MEKYVLLKLSCKMFSRNCEAAGVLGEKLEVTYIKPTYLLARLIMPCSDKNKQNSSLYPKSTEKRKEILNLY